MKPKRRLRLSISCERCRRRKIKCDRGQPCGNCIKRHVITECVYKKPLKRKIKQGQRYKQELFKELCRLRSENESLKHKIMDNNRDYTLKSSECASANFDMLLVKDRLIFHSVSTSRLSILRGDSGLASMFNEFSKATRKPKLYSILTDTDGLSIGCPSGKESSSTFNANGERLNHQLASSITAYKLKHRGNLLTPSNTGRNDLIHLIQDKLPSPFIIDALVQHFFNRVYYLMPFIDETAFQSELKFSIYPMDHGKHSVLNPKARTVFIVLLLLVMRFSYIAIPDGSVEKITDESARIVVMSGIKIEPEIVELARQLLFSQDGEFCIFKRVTLSSIQCLLYLHLYQAYSSEINEDSAENSIFVNMLVQMSMLIGLNRDPDMFPTLIKDKSIKILWRRIFYQIIWIDTLNAFNFGGLPMISEGYYDVKLPDLTEDEKAAISLFEHKNMMTLPPEKLKRLLLEGEINNSITANHNLCLLLHHMLSRVYRIDTKIEFGELMQFVDQLVLLKYQYCPNIFSLYGAIGKGRKKVDAIFSIPKSRLLLTAAFVYMYINTFAYLAFDIAKNAEDRKQASGKASQSAICLFKLSYDLADSLSKSSTDHSSQSILSLLCGDLQNLIFVRIHSCFERVQFWFISRSIREIDPMASPRILDEIEHFYNLDDLAEVKSWLLKDTAGLFQSILNHFKSYYSALSKLETRFFIAWRNKVMVTFLFTFIKRKCAGMKDEKLESTLQGILRSKISINDNSRIDIHGSNVSGKIPRESMVANTTTNLQPTFSSNLSTERSGLSDNNNYEPTLESFRDFDSQISDLFGGEYDLNSIYGSDDLVSLMGLNFE